MINRRHVYVLLFAVPALLVSIIAAALMLAASAGALWLFVYGDDPWPNTANVLLGAVFLLVAAALWLALLFVAYTVGRQQEGELSLNKRHVALSLGATVVLAAIIIVRLAGLNVAGAQSDSVVCADLCRSQGFTASGLPPRDSGDRTCSCYDPQGQEVRRVTLPLSR
jgi:hypothetical protein